MGRSPACRCAADGARRCTLAPGSQVKPQITRLPPSRQRPGSRILRLSQPRRSPPHAYVRSALREHKTREAASAIATLADAVEIVRAVADDAPILGDRDRLALPDEVLLLKSGSDREKALLLYALLHHGQANIPAPEFILTDHDSYVRAGGDLIGLRSLDKRAEVLGEILFHHV